MQRKTLILPVLGLVAALGLAACGSGSSGGSEKAFCAKVQNYVDQGESILPTGVSDTEGYDQVIAGLRDLEQSAPKAIKPDITVFLQAAEKFQSGDLQALSDPEFTAELQAAAQNLERYNTEVCKITPPPTEP